MANLTAPAPYDDRSLAIKLIVARESRRDCEPCHTPRIKTSLSRGSNGAAGAWCRRVPWPRLRRPSERRL